jgi:glycerophosphoryl diester phosphodiesterase
MLIIGHRGSQGTKHENTIASLREAMQANADMIEFDIRLTRDKIPVLSHNLHLYGTRKRELALLRRYTLAQLQERTGASDHPITTLDDVMRECFGRIYLNIELKEASAVTPTLEVISKYAKKKSDWDSILLSSFKPLALRAIRRKIPHVALGMLHHRNPLAFVGWHKLLQLSAVGFNRLYISPIALEIAKKLGLFTYAYTVNRKEAAQMLVNKGIDGIVTDYPARMLTDFENRS